MRPVRLKISVVALVVLHLIGGTDAWACECENPGPPCQNAFRVDAIFAGTVRSVTELPDDRPPLPPGQARIPIAVRVEFETVTAFRGIQGSTVSLVTAGSGPACGYTFKEGERYLVYAARGRDGGLSTGICSRTRAIKDAAEDLRFLENLAASRTKGARISGTIQHWERDVSSGQGQNYGPVSDVRVWIRGTGFTLDAFTDAQGRYDVTLPPGKYDITAMPPGEFATDGLSRSAELREVGACFVADFSVHLDGRIKGIIRHASGEPAAGIPVQVIAAQDAGTTRHIQSRTETTDVAGSFEFTSMSPGRYVVGVNLTRSIERGVNFPATFHPGTSDPALATQIELSGAQHYELEPMTLPPASSK